VPLGQTRAHLYSLTLVLTYTAVIHQCRRESQAVCEHAEASTALAVEQGVPYWAARGPILRGWAPAAQGQRAEGLALMQPGLAAWRALQRKPHWGMLPLDRVSYVPVLNVSLHAGRPDI
jgi:predicted ATPase